MAARALYLLYALPHLARAGAICSANSPHCFASAADGYASSIIDRGGFFPLFTYVFCVLCSVR
jgi:hypothetical protein